MDILAVELLEDCRLSCIVQAPVQVNKKNINLNCDDAYSKSNC